MFSFCVSVSSSFPQSLFAQQGARASRQVPAGVPAESRTLTFPLVYTLPPLTRPRDGLAARRRREGDLSKVYPAAPAVPGEPAGAPDLMRDPVELSQRRRRLGEAPTVAEGAEKEASGVRRCVSVCVGLLCCFLGESRSMFACRCPFISRYVSLLLPLLPPHPLQNSDYDV